jgi:hypothetical protein
MNPAVKFQLDRIFHSLPDFFFSKSNPLTFCCRKPFVQGMDSIFSSSVRQDLRDQLDFFLVFGCSQKKQPKANRLRREKPCANRSKLAEWPNSAADPVRSGIAMVSIMPFSAGGRWCFSCFFRKQVKTKHIHSILLILSNFSFIQNRFHSTLGFPLPHSARLSASLSSDRRELVASRIRNSRALSPDCP